MHIYGKWLSLVQVGVIFFIGLSGVSQALADDSAAIKKGDQVSLHYTGTLEDGSIFDTSKKRNEPLKFTAGSGQMIPGFDKAVMGMKKGEEKKFTLQPSEAYGDRMPNFKQTLPRKFLPKNFEPKLGMVVTQRTPSGQPIPVTITAVTKENITFDLDLNPTLAGKVLTFDIKIVEISH